MEKENIIVIQHPNEYKTGYRVLMRTLRSKDGGKINKPDRVAETVVAYGVDEYYEAFEKLLSKRTGQERIYSSVDERDIRKAIRIFKERQLEADYYNEEDKNSFYVDIRNRWISSLSNPKSAKTTLFLVDIDDDKDDALDIHNQIEKCNIEILHEYKTKNGSHLILKPFDPNIVTFPIQKNGMMLLAYNDYRSNVL